MCWNSRATIFRFNSNTQWQMFLLLYGRHVCVPTWRLHTKLYKFGWNTSANNAPMKNSRDLILGEVVYISIIYRIQEPWLLSLNGYDFIFDHMTGENREFPNILARISSLRGMWLAAAFTKTSYTISRGSITWRELPVILARKLLVFFRENSVHF